MKPKIVKDYDKLSNEIQEQIKLVYPQGFQKHLVSFVGKDGKKRMGLPFETDEVYYLVRMSVVEAKEIVEEDEDYNEYGVLKESVREEYDEKYSDVDYLAINTNEDNEMDAVEEDMD